MYQISQCFRKCKTTITKINDHENKRVCAFVFLSWSVRFAEHIGVRFVLGAICPGYKLSWVRVVLGTSWYGYELSWVRVILCKSCFRYELSRSPNDRIIKLCYVIQSTRSTKGSKRPPGWPQPWPLTHWGRSGGPFHVTTQLYFYSMTSKYKSQSIFTLGFDVA